MMVEGIELLMYPEAESMKALASVEFGNSCNEGKAALVDKG